MMKVIIEIWVGLAVLSTLFSPLLIGTEMGTYSYWRWLLNFIETLLIIYVCFNLLRFI